MLDQNRSEGGKKFEAHLKATELMYMVRPRTPKIKLSLCEKCHKSMAYCPDNKRYACNDCRILEPAHRAMSRVNLEDSKDCRHLNTVYEWNEKAKEYEFYCSDCGKDLVDISRKSAKVSKYPKRTCELCLGAQVWDTHFNAYKCLDCLRVQDKEPDHELDVIQRLSEEYRRIQKYEQIPRIETAA